MLFKTGGTAFATKGKFDVPSGDGNAYGVTSVFLVGTVSAADLRAIVCGDNAVGKGGLGACLAMSP